MEDCLPWMQGPSISIISDEKNINVGRDLQEIIDSELCIPRTYIYI